jgi:hypothetical protein
MRALPSVTDTENKALYFEMHTNFAAVQVRVLANQVIPFTSRAPSHKKS